jgi:hypothetical protein
MALPKGASATFGSSPDFLWHLLRFASEQPTATAPIEFKRTQLMHFRHAF